MSLADDLRLFLRRVLRVPTLPQACGAAPGRLYDGSARSPRAARPRVAHPARARGAVVRCRALAIARGARLHGAGRPVIAVHVCRTGPTPVAAHAARRRRRGPRGMRAAARMRVDPRPRSATRTLDADHAIDQRRVHHRPHGVAGEARCISTLIREEILASRRERAFGP